MEILHIISGVGGGVSTYIKNLIKTNHNYNFTILSFGKIGSFFDDCDKSNVELYEMPRPNQQGYLNFIKYLFKFFHKHKFDYVVSHIPGIHGLLFKLFVKDTPFSVHSHQTQYVYNKPLSIIDKLVTFLNPKINNFISKPNVSCGLDAAIYGFGINNVENTFIIYNSVNPEKFINIIDKKKRKDKIIIGHVGRHTRAKNFEFIIALAKEIKKQNFHNEMLILLAGNGELTQEINMKINVEELGDTIKLIGRVNNIEDFYEYVDVLILPSYSEGLPTVLVEAQASGIPCVISSTITKEVDIGLNLLHNKDIMITENNLFQWLMCIKEIYNNNIKLDKNLIIKALNIKGFTSKQMSKRFDELVLIATGSEINDQ